MEMENFNNYFSWIEGKLNWKLLKEFVNNFGDYETTLIKPGYKVKIETCYEGYSFDGQISDKFTDVVKYCQSLTFSKGDYISLSLREDGETVDLCQTSDGEFHLKKDCVLCFDSEEYVLRNDAYYCETDREYYESDEHLVWVDDCYYLEDDDDLSYCDRCDEYHLGKSYEVNTSRNYTSTWCERCVDYHAFLCEDCNEWWSEDYRNHVDYPDREVCDRCYDENYCYCEQCGRTVSSEYFNFDENCCDDCYDANGKYVKEYHWHHSNDYENKHSLFIPKGQMMKLGLQKFYKDTTGIELEVTKDSRDTEDECIEKLNTLIDNKNEIYYERDCSIGSAGFEIISGVHTFDSLKEMKWDEILKTLKEYGYRSHDGGLCGLHIHIGRKFFGDTEQRQATAIGHIYAFYSLFWDDIIKASRRDNFYYCDHPFTEYIPSEIKEDLSQNPKETRKKLYMKAYDKEGGHRVALNNSNPNTFEIRMGRGTLIYKSFMAWIDFTFTMAKNSKTITMENIIDCDAWLNGISYETAIYLNSRNAFTESKIIKKLIKE